MNFELWSNFDSIYTSRFLGNTWNACQDQLKAYIPPGKSEQSCDDRIKNFKAGRVQMWTLDNKRIEWDRVTVMEVKKNKRDTKVSVKGDETWKKILAHVQANPNSTTDQICNQLVGKTNQNTLNKYRLPIAKALSRYGNPKENRKRQKTQASVEEEKSDIPKFGGNEFLIMKYQDLQEQNEILQREVRLISKSAIADKNRIEQLVSQCENLQTDNHMASVNREADKMRADRLEKDHRDVTSQLMRFTAQNDTLAYELQRAVSMRNRFSDAFSAHERLRIDCAVAAGKSWFPWLSVGEGDGVVHQNYTEWRKNRPVTLVKAILEYWQLSIGGVHFNQTAEIEVMYELESALLSLYAVKDAEAEVDHPAGCNQQHRQAFALFNVNPSIIDRMAHINNLPIANAQDRADVRESISQCRELVTAMAGIRLNLDGSVPKFQGVRPRFNPVDNDWVHRDFNHLHPVREQVADAIRALPLRRALLPGRRLHEACPICLTSLIVQCYNVECGHNLCAQCWERIFTERDTCPLCVQPIAPKVLGNRQN